MERELLCPRTEICPIYGSYVNLTKDNRLGVIKVSKIENRDYYGCRALNKIKEFMREGKLPKEITGRIKSENLECFIIDQANKRIEKRRPDA